MERCTLYHNSTYLIRNLINTLSLASDTPMTSRLRRRNDAAITRRSRPRLRRLGPFTPTEVLETDVWSVQDVASKARCHGVSKALESNQQPPRDRSHCPLS